MTNSFHHTHKAKHVKRRNFLKATMAALALGGCSHGQELLAPFPEISETQAARRKHGRSKIAIIPCPFYNDDLFKTIKELLNQINLPDLRYKKVVIKPNMVEFQPGKPICTHPAVIKAAIELVDYLGAREIVIGEGPGHMRDTEFLLMQTGIGKVCSQLGLEFVDLNLDKLEKINNTDGFSGVDAFYLPKTIVDADAIISVPKLKTHHWVGVTASMKNLFGTVPGRKYGWPKNLLHVRGIPYCIIDLVHLVKPTFTLVDAIISMEGDGPINGTGKKTGFLVLGTDVAAADATCARTMNIEPTDLFYMQLANKVISNISEENIDIVGTPVNSVRQTFARPITFENRKLAAQAAQQSS